MNSSNRLIWMFAWLIVDVKAYKSGCSGGYCFVISETSNSNEYFAQSNAQQWCRSNWNHLVEIRNKDIQNSLINFIRSEQGLNGWNVLTNGKRSVGNWIRLSGNGVGGITFYEQTDTSYAYGYLKSTTSGFDMFASRSTDNKGGFICTGLSDCSGGVMISGQCYKSVTETLSWYEARNRCLDAGGDLASFDYITSNAGFNALNGSWINARNSYWIGIRREWWTWQSSSSDVRYSDWITGHPINYQPNTECLCLSTTAWKWTECDCNQRLPFVCISDNVSTTVWNTTASTETATTTTPNSTSTTTFTTTRSTTSTTRSTTSAAKTTSKAASSMASESNGVSTPTIPATATSKSTGNDTGVMELSMGLSREAIIGIGVGVGLGGALIITASVIVVIILCRKRCSLRQAPPTLETTSSTNQIGKPVGVDLQERNGLAEDPYESLQPRIERTATSDGLYQSLDHSKKTDGNVLYSNI